MFDYDDSLISREAVNFSSPQNERKSELTQQHVCEQCHFLYSHYLLWSSKFFLKTDHENIPCFVDGFLYTLHRIKKLILIFQ